MLVARSIFLLSLSLLVFIVGMEFADRKMLPYRLFQHGKETLTALRQWFQESREIPNLIELADAAPAQVTGAVAQEFAHEYVLLAGGYGQWSNQCPPDGCLAVIVERSGKVVHSWPFRSSEIFESEHHAGLLEPRQVYPFGYELLDNGDLLVSFQTIGAFPYAYGLARYALDGTLLWRKLDLNHHWFDTTKDGLTYAPSMRVIEGPLRVSDSSLKCDGGSYYEDLIKLYDDKGEERGAISMLNLLISSGYEGLVSMTSNPCDPTHLNDIRLLDSLPDGVSSTTRGKPALVSFRNINTVAIVDLEQEKVLWLKSGTTGAQHSPRLTPEGVVVFDNHAGDEESEIVLLDVTSEDKAVIYPPPTSGSASFYSRAAGQINLSSDRSRALVSESRAGRVLEIDMRTGEVLWEFVNWHELAEPLSAPDVRGERGKFARFQTVGAYYLAKRGMDALLPSR